MGRTILTANDVSASPSKTALKTTAAGRPDTANPVSKRFAPRWGRVWRQKSAREARAD